MEESTVLLTCEFERKSLLSSLLTVSSENVLCKQFIEEFASKVMSSFSFCSLSVSSIPIFAQSICIFFI